MLYFAYTARIDPSKMAEVAPGADFAFIAHLSEWGLEFPIAGNGWKGGLPTVSPMPGDTVWGAVFSLPDKQIAAVDAVELEERRERAVVEAIDRTGRRHQVALHRAIETGGRRRRRPSPDYVELMVSGARHWGLPAGWIVRLQDHMAG